MSRKQCYPIDLPAIALPSDDEWKTLFPIADSRPLVFVDAKRFKKRLRSVRVGCEHFLGVLSGIPLVYAENRVDSTTHGTFDFIYAPLGKCKHPLGTVLRRTLEGIESWRSIGTRAIFVLARCLAVVMAKRLERDNKLWDVVFEWIVACVEKPAGEAAKIMAMEFLAQLHVETNGELRRTFPELVAKLGDIGNVTKFGVGFKYCLDVAHEKLSPTIKPSIRCQDQPFLVVSRLLKTDLLEKFLGHLDYASVSNLRATCQLVRGAVDGLPWSVRRRIGRDRKADLWMRDSNQLHVRDIVITNKLGDKYQNHGVYDVALVRDQIYFVVTKSSGALRLEAANIALPESVFQASSSDPYRAAFDRMAFRRFLSKHDVSYIIPDLPDKDIGVSWRYIEGTVQEPDGKHEVLVSGTVVGSYVGNKIECSFKIKASYSKDTVFVLFRRKVDATKSHFLLEALDVKSRSVSVVATFDASFEHSEFDHFSCLYPGDEFVIAQVGKYEQVVARAFARTGDKWFGVGESHAGDTDLATFLMCDGLAVWTLEGRTWHESCLQTVVNVLDVRPAALARISRNGDNVFETAKKIRVPGEYVVRTFERGFFALEYCKRRRLIKLRVVDLEEMSSSPGGWKELDDGSVELDVQKEDNDNEGASTAKKRKQGKE